MTCPHCRSRATSRRLRRTELGYRRFQCRTCRRRFNERTGTRFNEIRFPSDVVMLAVLWRLRYKLSLRDVAEMLLERGYQVTHETVRTWEASFAPLLSERLRAKRRGRIGSSWHIDETYVKVAGRWCYLYRAIDGDGQLIDSMLSEHRDKHAARRFFRGLVDVAEARPLRVTTDRHPAYPRRGALDSRAEGRAPDDPVPQQLHGARPPRREAALLPDAGLRQLRLGRPVLYGVR